MEENGFVGDAWDGGEDSSSFPSVTSLGMTSVVSLVTSLGMTVGVYGLFSLEDRGMVL